MIRLRASGLERAYACNGSPALEAEARRDVPPQESEDASFGTIVHRILSGSDDLSATGEHRDVADQLGEKASALASELGFDASRYESETDFPWTPDYPVSGHADRIYSDSKRLLVVDFKTGHNATTASADNLQLAAYGLKAWSVLKGTAEEVMVAIIDRFRRPQVASYTHSQLLTLVKSIASLHDRVNRPAPNLSDGDHCQYCDAKLICPKLNAQVQRVTDEHAEEGVTKAGVEGAVMTLDGKRLAGILEVQDRVRWLMDAAKTEAKRRLETSHPEAPPGWTLKPGASSRVITDPARVWRNASARYAITEAEFIAATDVGLGKLKSALKARTDLKGKALDEALERVIDGAVELQQRAPSLVRE